MTNKNIFEIIEKLISTEIDDLNYTPNEVFIAAAHGYYYVHSGKDTERFLNEINRVLEKAKEYTNTAQGEIENENTYKEILEKKMASEMLEVIRSRFNRATLNYSKEVMQQDMNNVFSNEYLEYRLYYLDHDELEDIFDKIFEFKHNVNPFITNESYGLMMNEFKECSLYVAENEAYDENDYDEDVDFINHTPRYFFHYLCRETIIDIIYRHIDTDPIILAYMVKAYTLSNINNITDYTAIVLRMTHEHGIDVFNMMNESSTKYNS